MTFRTRVDRFARRVPLAVKLAWLGGGLTAIVIGAMLLAVTLEIRASTRRRFAEELRRNQGTFARLQQQKLEQLTFAASLISRTASLPYALDTYRAEAASGVKRTDLAATVQRELEQLIFESGKDLLLVTDESGRVFASVARRGATVPAGTDLSGLPAVKEGLDPRERVARGGLAVLRQPDGNYQVAVYPVELGGYTLGTLLLGERLDSGFVAAARAAFDGYVVVTVGDSIASGTLPGALAGRARSLFGAPDGGEPAMLSVGDEEFVVAPLGLGETQDHAPARLWLLQPLTATVRALTRPLVQDFLLYGILAVLCAGVGAALLAHTLLRPLDRFVRYLRQGKTAERLDARFEAGDAPAEVQTLNESFNELMDALRVSEAQLRQAQKLEAVGTLAGGIAHDFNNLLTVITGFTQMALARTEPAAPLREDLEQVISASERATVLTRQLLAFSRKQVLQPVVLDLGEVVDDLAPMLRRLIGEHIPMQLERSRPSLSPVRADRGQLEQVIINLAVNARDAMPRGGRLEIRLAQTEGNVTLSVVDTGTGIPDDVRERMFEPFFTTKEPGKGTGLGLSTVYGIVKQTGGTIDVVSMLGKGTTITISLPACVERVAAVQAPDDTAIPRGSETILLVEDDPSVRALAQRALEGLGYSVLPASGHKEAMEVAEVALVDLLLTDVVMPEVGGPDLTEGIRRRQPTVEVVYMSGYTDDALRSYALAPDVSFLRKPFTTVELARVVRASLDARESPGRVVVG